MVLRLMGISLAVGKIRCEHICHPGGRPQVVTRLLRLRPSLQVTVIVIAQANTHPVAVEQCSGTRCIGCEYNFPHDVRKRLVLSLLPVVAFYQ
jgi:hypothetical protein